MFGFNYIIGDPVVREKIAHTVRVTVKSVTIAFALVGVFAVLVSICQILAW